MSGNLLTQRINTYFALLAITIIGAGGALMIMHVANQTTYAALGIGTAQYAAALVQ